MGDYRWAEKILVFDKDCNVTTVFNDTHSSDTAVLVTARLCADLAQIESTAKAAPWSVKELCEAAGGTFNPGKCNCPDGKAILLDKYDFKKAGCGMVDEKAALANIHKFEDFVVLRGGDVFPYGTSSYARLKTQCDEFAAFFPPASNNSDNDLNNSADGGSGVE